MSDPVAKSSIFSINKKRVFFYLITFAIIIAVTLKIDELKEIEEVFRGSHYQWIIAAVLAQGVYYYFLALNFKILLFLKGLKINKLEALNTTIIAQFFSHVIPSGGISGQIFQIYHSSRRGLQVSAGISRMILDSMTQFMAIAVLFLITIGLMIKRGTFSAHPEVLTLIYIFLVLTVIVLFLFLFMQRGKARKGKIAKWIGKKFDKQAEKMNLWNSNGFKQFADHASHINVFFEQFRETLKLDYLRANAKNFMLGFLWQVLALIAQSFVFFFTARALGFQLSYEVVFITATLIKFLFMISVTPGGIGIIEFFATVIFVGFGLTKGEAFSVTILARAITFWLPIPLGWYLYHRYLKKNYEQISETKNT